MNSPYKGKKMPASFGLKVSMAKKGKPNGRLGYKHTSETIEKIRLARSKQNPPVPAGFKYFNKNKTKESIILRMSLFYKKWRETIFIRDAYTCQECGQVGGKLNVDHIKSFARFPELRFDINNGRTLCVDCHRKTDTWGGRSKKGFKFNLAIV